MQVFPKDRLWGPLFFLTYIDDLSNGLKSNPVLFADDTSLFSVTHDVNSSQIDNLQNQQLGIDKTNNWAHQWKMSFNTDISKKAQEVIFKKKSQQCITLSFNF